MADLTLVKQHFAELNKELEKRNALGEIGFCGGRAIFLCFFIEKDTKEVEEIFHPTRLLREAIGSLGKRLVLSDDWMQEDLNTFFHADPPREDVFHLSHLRILAPLPSYLYAMKCSAPSLDSPDIEELKFLIGYLKIETRERALAVVSDYYPKGRIPSAVQSVVEKLIA